MWELVKEVVIIIRLDLNNNKSWRTLKNSQKLLKSSITSVVLAGSHSVTLCAPPLPIDDHSSVKHKTEPVVTKLSHKASPQVAQVPFVFTQRKKPEQVFLKSAAFNCSCRRKGDLRVGITLEDGWMVPWLESTLELLVPSQPFALMRKRKVPPRTERKDCCNSWKATTT